MTPAPPRPNRGTRRPFVAHLPRLLWVCLTKYPIAALGSVLAARLLAAWLDLNQMDAAVGWLASALLASGVWYTLEPSVQRLWGARPPNKSEWLRLKTALSATNLAPDLTVTTFLTEEDARVAVRTGLRTLVVTHRALHELDDRRLGELLAHGLMHVNGKSASPYVRCNDACMAL